MQPMAMAREKNEGEQGITSGFGFISDWLKMWREIVVAGTKRRSANLQTPNWSICLRRLINSVRAPNVTSFFFLFLF